MKNSNTYKQLIGRTIPGNTISISGVPFIENGNTVSWTLVNSEKKELRPEKIIYNDRTTIVYWNDSTKTISTCDVNDKFDKKAGFASCLLKKMFGKKVHGKKLFDRMIEGAECHNLIETGISFDKFKEMSKPLVKLSKSIK